MKGLSMTMRVVIVVVILMVAAIVVLTIYGGQMGGIAAQLSQWAAGAGGPQDVETCAKAGGVCRAVADCAGSINYVAACPAGTFCCIG
jgi:hypothetical protein